jgi:RNA 3'-terminal phosphate cyclase (ATP)
MLEIDGSQGEGGGQVLRSSLALSILTGQALRLVNIRARRSKPGLQAQHLKAVDAAAALSRAEVIGASMGSTRLDFHPGEIRPGRYKFEIGTAGSTSLVLQTIFLPLSRASSASTVMISGGTHVPWAPCFHYLDLHWLPILRRLGFDAHLSLDAAGFYPQGGGRVTATIRPAGPIQPLRLEERGELNSLGGISAVANLDLSIADRQRRQALRRLPTTPAPRIKTVQLPAPFKGTCLLLLAVFGGALEAGAGSGDPTPQDGYAQCCYYGLGELGKPAERVADEAVEAYQEFLETPATIDQYLADQLLLPLALACGPSRFRTARVTSHLVTNASIVQAFLPAKIQIEGAAGEPGLVSIEPGAQVSS